MNDRVSALAAALVARANHILPPPFYAEAGDSVVFLFSPDDGQLRDIDLMPALSLTTNFAEAAEAGALQVLGDVQTDVIESARAAWPTADGRTAPADAYASVSGSTLALGYRYPDRAVIDLEPIDLDRLPGP